MAFTVELSSLVTAMGGPSPDINASLPTSPPRRHIRLLLTPRTIWILSVPTRTAWRWEWWEGTLAAATTWEASSASAQPWRTGPRLSSPPKALVGKGCTRNGKAVRVGLE